MLIGLLSQVKLSTCWFRTYDLFNMSFKHSKHILSMDESFSFMKLEWNDSRHRLFFWKHDKTHSSNLIVYPCWDNFHAYYKGSIDSVYKTTYVCLNMAKFSFWTPCDTCVGTHICHSNKHWWTLKWTFPHPLHELFSSLIHWPRAWPGVILKGAPQEDTPSFCKKKAPYKMAQTDYCCSRALQWAPWPQP